MPVDPSLHRCSGDPRDSRLDTVPALLRTLARTAPQAVAVCDGARTLTYAELDARSRAVGSWLRYHDVRAGAVVGICAGRGLELVIGCLGAWRAGAAYLPLDPDHPAVRRRGFLDDAGAAALLTTATHLAEAAAGLPVLDLATAGDLAPESPERVTHAADAAYVIYTSGSSGTPKGVVVQHDSLADLAEWHRDAFAVSPADRVAQVAGVGFDASVWETWGTLSAGAMLVVPPPDVRVNPDRLRDWLVAERITVTFVPTVLAEQLLLLPWPDDTALRVLLTGGERLQRRPPAGLRFTLVNCYGPTECTVVATATPVLPGAGVPDIGAPRPGIRALVLDADLKAVPDGEPGELFLGGTGVARGYLARPALTAERFLPDPDGPPGARLYRTGDLVRRGPGGRLEFLGRSDGQVKVRGHRIEPGEVEAALATHPDLATAVVTARASGGGPTQLVAHVVPAPGRTVIAEDVREHLRGLLPEPLVPQAIVVLPELPLTPNGKIDKYRLPEPDRAAAFRGIAPRGAVEGEVLRIWQDVLRTDLGSASDALGVDDAFVAAGGTSLSAARLAGRLAERFGVDIPLRSFFAELTVAEVARRIDEFAPSLATSAARFPDVPPATGDGTGQPVPVNSAQRRLWLLQSIAPNPALYTNVLQFRLTGALDRLALQRALNDLVRRHEALRTRILDVGGEPVQQVMRPWPVQLAETDLRGAPPEHLRRLLDAETAAAFDLAAGRPLRASLLRIGADEWQLVLTVHHVCFDGWSIGVVIRDLAAAYAGEQPLPLPRRYAEHARCEVAQLSGARGDRLREFWAANLAGEIPTPALPCDRPRPQSSRFAGRTVATEVSPALLQAAEALARSERATLFTAALAVLTTVLHRTTGQRDLIVGAPAANRPDAGFEDLVGCFVNIVPLRCDLSARPTFRQLLGRLHGVVLNAVEHQQLPFEEIVAAAGVAGHRGARPLVQVMLAVQPPTPDVRAGELEVAFAGEAHGATARFDLTVSLERTGGTPVLALEYDAELFEPVTAQRLLDQLMTLLAEAVADPDRCIDDLPMLSAAERRRVLDLGRGERRPVPATTVPELVRRNALATPDAVGVECADERLTYAELVGAVDGVAWQLRTAGVRSGVPVAVCFERSCAPVVGLLGTLTAGGVYVPLDPTHPDQRLADILADVRPAVVLTSPALRGRLAALAPGVPVITPDGRAHESPPPPPDRDPTAYALYTSGSTGRPKGVLVRSASLVNLVLEKIRRFDLRPGSRALQYVPFGFGVSVSDVCTTLAAGATLVVRGPELLAGAALASFVRTHRVTHLVLPASVLAGMPDDDLPDLRVVVVGGEPCPADVITRVAPRRTFVQAYGPTEATVCSATAQCSPAPGRPPVGRPLANVDVFVLDDRLHPLPQGAIGEVFIGGLGLARGYLGQPALTAQCFLPHPFAGELAPAGARIYRTGDLGRFRSDGQLELLGRTDDQVQLRGIRVEITEIDAALRALPGVTDAAARVHQHPATGAQLVGYVVATADVDVAPEQLRALLRERLPEALVPAVVLPVPALPRTVTGKLDRRALPDPPERSGRRGGPRSAVEEMVAETWREVLSVDVLDVDDDFFALGGHSLLAAQVAARLRDRFEVEFPTRAVFEAPTLAELAVRIEQAVLADLRAEAAAG